MTWVFQGQVDVVGKINVCIIIHFIMGVYLTHLEPFLRIRKNQPQNQLSLTNLPSPMKERRGGEEFFSLIQIQIIDIREMCLKVGGGGGWYLTVLFIKNNLDSTHHPSYNIPPPNLHRQVPWSSQATIIIRLAHFPISRFFFSDYITSFSFFLISIFGRLFHP